MAAGTGKYAVAGNVLEIAVKRRTLSLDNGIDFEFKWNDNMQDEGNIMDFYVNGDTAPGGRFNYVYTAAGESQSGIDAPYSDTALSVRTVGSNLEIESEKPFRVITPAGTPVASCRHSATVTVPAPGLYIVTSAHRSVKVSVK